MLTKLVVLSRPDVGSSKKSNDGSATISIAMFTRFRCPPLIPRFSVLPTTCRAHTRAAPISSVYTHTRQGNFAPHTVYWTALVLTTAYSYRLPFQSIVCFVTYRVRDAVDFEDGHDVADHGEAVLAVQGGREPQARVHGEVFFHGQVVVHDVVLTQGSHLGGERAKMTKE